MAPPATERDGEVSVAATMLGSAMAGILARVVCHPLDVAKANLQVAGQVAYRNSYHVLQSTFQKEGVRGLYRGFGVILLGSAPATCLYLTSYDQSKRWLESHPAFQSNVFVTSFSAGVMAEALSCVFWVPIDVIKERMQVQRKTGGGVFYKNAVDAWRTIARTEGVRGLYRGYGATLWSFGPFSAFFFLFYEKNKAVAEAVHGTDDVPFASLLACSVTASAGASIVTNPLDLVKLRMQIERMQQHPTAATYQNTFQALQRVARKEGFVGLWKGVGARVAFQAPLTGLTLALFEKCKHVCAFAV
ncbi:hypothetical protein H310_14681 [Aphanomyces invadans]|uniref:Mitochondrial carrier protein n=1 Tax=Aphanomyces invadans TaxID=157072 RepID=A0A024TAA6_9STRA|nr:hypothetical protein H310_14681 [Aphanomyces invadans]ETV90556.1 hypothetical protein H310_14681 [Aphanomyces invadans]|eukprot:XP_008880806.1 hypothetical protein H310_14681 [Aphanomyces invadans]